MPDTRATTASDLTHEHYGLHARINLPDLQCEGELRGITGWGDEFGPVATRITLGRWPTTVTVMVDPATIVHLFTWETSAPTADQVEDDHSPKAIEATDSPEPDRA